MASTIARPRPVPPRERARSPRVKRSKAWPFSAGSNPGPAVEHVQAHAVAGGLGRQLHGTLAVAQSVVDEIRERLLGAEPVARAAPGRRSSATLQLAAGLRRPRAEAARRGGEQLSGVELLRPDGQPALVGAGQHEQILGELDEPVALGGCRRHAPRAAPPESGPRGAPARAPSAGAPAACAARGSRSPRSRARARPSARAGRASRSACRRAERARRGPPAREAGAPLPSREISAASARIALTGRSAAVATP